MRQGEDNGLLPSLLARYRSRASGEGRACAQQRFYQCSASLLSAARCACCAAQVLWMNKVLRTLWPYYNAAIGQQVLDQATPIIAEQLKPVWPPCPAQFPCLPLSRHAAVSPPVPARCSAVCQRISSNFSLARAAHMNAPMRPVGGLSVLGSWLQLRVHPSDAGVHPQKKQRNHACLSAGPLCAGMRAINLHPRACTA